MGALPFPLLAACSPPRAFGQRLKLRAALRVCFVLGLVLTATRFADAQTLPVPTLPPAEPSAGRANTLTNTQVFAAGQHRLAWYSTEQGRADRSGTRAGMGVQRRRDRRLRHECVLPARRPGRRALSSTRRVHAHVSRHAQRVASGRFRGRALLRTAGQPESRERAQLGLSGRRALTPTTDLTGDVVGGLGRTDAERAPDRAGDPVPGRPGPFPPCAPERSSHSSAPRTSLGVTAYGSRRCVSTHQQLVDSQSLGRR